MVCDARLVVRNGQGARSAMSVVCETKWRACDVVNQWSCVPDMWSVMCLVNGLCYQAGGRAVSVAGVSFTFS